MKEVEISVPMDVMQLAACECGSLHFRPAVTLLCYKGILSQQQPLIKPVQGWQCVDCSKILPTDKGGYPTLTIPMKMLKS